MRKPETKEYQKMLNEYYQKVCESILNCTSLANNCKKYQDRNIDCVYGRWFILATDQWLLQFVQTTAPQEGQATPSLSPTPSPAGSVGSVGSQSSGYSSGELANRGAASGQTPFISVPLNIHTVMSKQNNQFSMLCSCHDLWDQATALVTDKNKGTYIYVYLFIIRNKLCYTISVLT